MSRKKSAKKADFQKVKLKVGRSLPKGLNVTQTAFKTKKIKVPGQCRDPRQYNDPGQCDDAEKEKKERIQRNQKVKDLLKKAQHSSVSIRHNAFLEVFKFLNSFKELLEIHLAQLLEVLSTGFHDDSHSVRDEAINLCCLILKNVPEVKISAASRVFLLHLCCAMTSIHHTIRMDSLKVLELCLNAVPSVIISSERILKNFVTLISFDKSHPVLDQSGFRVNHKSKKTASDRVKSHHWRVDVLCILTRFLKAVIHSHSKKTDEYFWPTHYSSIKIPGTGHKVVEFSDLEGYFASLMPVLFEIWIEAALMPYPKSDSGQIISAEDAKVMDNVLQVIRLICEWINIVDKGKNNKDMLNWFSKEYRKQLFGRLMVCFPYSQRTAVKRKRQPIGTDMSCLTVNLALCHVFSMMPPTTSVVYNKLYQQVNDYLLHVINRDNSGGVASVSIIVKILKNFLTSSKLENFERHLNGLLKCYKKLKDGGKQRVEFLDFITDVVSNFGNKEIIENMPMMKHLAQSLLQDLFKMHEEKKVEKHTLSIIKQLNVIGVLPFVTELQENSGIVLELIKNEEVEIQNTAVCLLSRLTHIPVGFFLELVKTIFDYDIPVNTVNHLLGTLSYGLKRPFNGIPAFMKKDFANFLFCLGVGMYRHEADTYMGLAQAEQDKCRDVVPFHLSRYSIAPSNDLQYHYGITQAAIRALMGFHDRKQMSLWIHKYVMQFTTQCASFPVHSALALLLLENEAFKSNCWPDDTDCLLCIAELTIACFLYQDAWERDKEPAEIEPGSIIGALTTEILKTVLSKNMKNVFSVIVQRITDIHSIEQVPCIGRLLLVVLRKELVQCEDLNELVGVMEVLYEVFGNEIQYEPLWQAIRHQLTLPHDAKSN